MAKDTASRILIDIELNSQMDQFEDERTEIEKKLAKQRLEYLKSQGLSEEAAMRQRLKEEQEIEEKKRLIVSSKHAPFSSRIKKTWDYFREVRVFNLDHPEIQLMLIAKIFYLRGSFLFTELPIDFIVNKGCYFFVTARFEKLLKIRTFIVIFNVNYFNINS